MTWLDLGEGILEEFSVRASFDAGEFAMIGLVAGAMRTFRRQAPARTVECSVCQVMTDRAGGTCSKRCTQIRRRLDLIAAAICIRCKTRPARDDAQSCNQCKPSRRSSIKQRLVPKTERCSGPECCNHVMLGKVGKPAKFCQGACKNREMNRRKKDRAKSSAPAQGDRALVTSCSSEDPDARGVRVMFIGKRGRVVSTGEVTTVQFYREKRQVFHVNELMILS